VHVNLDIREGDNSPVISEIDASEIPDLVSYDRK
jgi:hypothetical protein